MSFKSPRSFVLKKITSLLYASIQPSSSVHHSGHYRHKSLPLETFIVRLPYLVSVSSLANPTKQPRRIAQNCCVVQLMPSACMSLLSASVLSEIAFYIVCVGQDLQCASLDCILCSWDSVPAVGNSNQPLGLCFSQHNQHNTIYTSGNSNQPLVSFGFYLFIFCVWSLLTIVLIV